MKQSTSRSDKQQESEHRRCANMSAQGRAKPQRGAAPLWVIEPTIPQALQGRHNVGPGCIALAGPGQSGSRGPRAALRTFPCSSRCLKCLPCTRHSEMPVATHGRRNADSISTICFFRLAQVPTSLRAGPRSQAGYNSRDRRDPQRDCFAKRETSRRQAKTRQQHHLRKHDLPQSFRFAPRQLLSAR
jgi:hypothetical protein